MIEIGNYIKSHGPSSNPPFVLNAHIPENTGPIVDRADVPAAAETCRVCIPRDELVAWSQLNLQEYAGVLDRQKRLNQTEIKELSRLHKIIHNREAARVKRRQVKVEKEELEAEVCRLNELVHRLERDKAELQVQLAGMLSERGVPL